MKKARQNEILSEMLGYMYNLLGAEEEARVLLKLGVTEKELINDFGFMEEDVKAAIEGIEEEG